MSSQHWHGIFQKYTNWADGADGVNQCPIIPGEKFLYDFTVPNESVSPLGHASEMSPGSLTSFKGDVLVSQSLPCPIL